MKRFIILNLINAVINLSKAQLAYLEILDFIWVIIAIISITAMYIFLFKRSYTSEILKSEVDSVKLKKSFGTERILIKLKSGKIRPLYLKKTTNELEFLNEALGINNL